MQVIALQISKKEEKEYHSFAAGIRELSLMEWVKTYIFVAGFAMLVFLGMYIFAGDFTIGLFVNTPKPLIVAGFLAVFVLAAYRRAKNMQLQSLKKKYGEDQVMKELIDGHLSLDKIQVRDGKLLFICHKY